MSEVYSSRRRENRAYYSTSLSGESFASAGSIAEIREKHPIPDILGSLPRKFHYDIAAYTPSD